MNKSACYQVLGGVWGLVLCACFVGHGQAIYPLGDGVLPGDPNVPVPPEVNEPWDPAQHLAAGWRSMTLSTRLWNSAEPLWAWTPPGRSLSFDGLINVMDANGLIGLAELAADALACDETGQQLATVRVSQFPPYYMPLKYATMLWVPTGEVRVSVVPYEFSIDMSMEPNAPFPVVLSRLEWSMSVLLSDRFEVIDIPFAPTADWIELVPGLEIRVEQAAAQNEQYHYQMKARYNPNRVSYPDDRDPPAGRPRRAGDVPYFWPDGALPEMIVTAIEVVDAAGKSVWQRGAGTAFVGTSRGWEDSGDQRIVTRSDSGDCPACGTAAFIRHVIAFDPYHRDVRFVLQDVPVPGL